MLFTALKRMRVELVLIVGIIFFCCWCAYIIVKMNSSVATPPLLSLDANYTTGTNNYHHHQNASYQVPMSKPQIRHQQQTMNTHSRPSQQIYYNSYSRHPEANSPATYFASPNATTVQHQHQLLPLKAPYSTQTSWRTLSGQQTAVPQMPGVAQNTGAFSQDYSSVTPPNHHGYRWPTQSVAPQPNGTYYSPHRYHHHHQYPPSQSSQWLVVQPPLAAPPSGKYLATESGEQVTTEQTDSDPDPDADSQSVAAAAADDYNEAAGESRGVGGGGGPGTGEESSGIAAAADLGEAPLNLSNDDEEEEDENNNEVGVDSEGGEAPDTNNNELEEQIGRRSFSEDESRANERDKNGHLVVTHRRHLINGIPVNKRQGTGKEQKSSRAKAKLASSANFDKIVNEIEDKRGDGYEESVDGGEKQHQQTGESRLRAMAVRSTPKPGGASLGLVNLDQPLLGAPTSGKKQVLAGAALNQSIASAYKAGMSQLGSKKGTGKDMPEVENDDKDDSDRADEVLPKSRRDSHEHRLRESLTAQQWDDDGAAPNSGSAKQALPDEDKPAHLLAHSNSTSREVDPPTTTTNSSDVHLLDSSAQVGEEDSSSTSASPAVAAQEAEQADEQAAEEDEDEQIEFKDLDLFADNNNNKFPFMEDSTNDDESRRKRKRRRRKRQTTTIGGDQVDWPTKDENIISGRFGASSQLVRHNWSQKQEHPIDRPALTSLPPLASAEMFPSSTDYDEATESATKLTDLILPSTRGRRLAATTTDIGGNRMASNNAESSEKGRLDKINKSSSSSSGGLLALEPHSGRNRSSNRTNGSTHPLLRAVNAAADIATNRPQNGPIETFQSVSNANSVVGTGSAVSSESGEISEHHHNVNKALTSPSSSLSTFRRQQVPSVTLLATNQTTATSANTDATRQSQPLLPLTPTQSSTFDRPTRSNDVSRPSYLDNMGSIGLDYHENRRHLPATLMLSNDTGDVITGQEDISVQVLAAAPPPSGGDQIANGEPSVFVGDSVVVVPPGGGIVHQPPTADNFYAGSLSQAYNNSTTVPPNGHFDGGGNQVQGYVGANSFYHYQQPESTHSPGSDANQTYYGPTRDEPIDPPMGYHSQPISGNQQMQQQQFYNSSSFANNPLASEGKKKQLKVKKKTSKMSEAKYKAAKAMSMKKKSKFKKGGMKKRKDKAKKKFAKSYKEFKGSTKGKKGAKGSGQKGGKKGALYYKDMGYKKRGFKKAYKKLETGDHKTYFDEFRDKDHNKKWKNFKDKHHYSQKKSWAGNDKKKYKSYDLKDLRDKKSGYGNWKENSNSKYKKAYKYKGGVSSSTAKKKKKKTKKKEKFAS